MMYEWEIGACDNKIEAGAVEGFMFSLPVFGGRRGLGDLDGLTGGDAFAQLSRRYIAYLIPPGTVEILEMTASCVVCPLTPAVQKRTVR